MKLSGKFVCAGPFLFLLYAVPAFAQFEISPDHFDSVVNLTPQKPPVASKRGTARQHLGARPAASQQSQAQNSLATRAGTRSFENSPGTSGQRHGHPRKGILGAKQSARIQPQHQTSQVAQVRRE